MQNWHLGKFWKMDEHTTVVHVVTFNTNLIELRSHAQGLHWDMKKKERSEKKQEDIFHVQMKTWPECSGLAGQFCLVAKQLVNLFHIGWLRQDTNKCNPQKIRAGTSNEQL